VAPVQTIGVAETVQALRVWRGMRDAALTHHGDPIGNADGFLLIVRHNQCRHAERAQDFAQLDAQ